MILKIFYFDDRTDRVTMLKPKAASTKSTPHLDYMVS